MISLSNRIGPRTIQDFTCILKIQVKLILNCLRAFAMTCLSHKGLNFWGNCIRAQCPRDEALQCRHKRQNKRNWPIDSINILFSKYSWQRYTASFSSIAGIKTLPQIAKRLSQHLVMVPSWLRKNALCLCQLAFSIFAQCRKWFRDKQLDWFDLHYFILFLTSNSDLTIY